MITRITLIENTGNYQKFTNGNVNFNPVTIIYGENRNGKSTFCDIFHSLALNDPKIIMDRKSINPSNVTSQAQQKIKIQFSTDDKKEIVAFTNDSWDSPLPDNYQLHVFDQGFIYRNVMAGMTYNRDNSKNISSYILGENSVKFEELEVDNQKLREIRESIRILTSRFHSHNIHNIDDFIASPLSSLSLTQINAKIKSSKELQQKTSAQITNTIQVSRRSNLEGVIKPRAIDTELKSINDCLGFNMENVHEASKAAVATHKMKVDSSNLFDTWAAKGIIHLKDDCPFCGQELEREAQSLIKSYQTAFDDNFQNFVAQTKSKANSLKRKSLLNTNIEDIREKHDRNLAFLDTYIEADIRSNLEVHDYINQLIRCFQSIDLALSDLYNANDSIAQTIEDALNYKYEVPYSSLPAIDFTQLKNKFSIFDDSIAEYNSVKEKINVELNLFKASQNTAALQNLVNTEIDAEKLLLSQRKRLDMNEDCIEFSGLCSDLQTADDEYKKRKIKLEGDQEEFLNNYFDEINRIFSSIGTKNFEISRGTNNIGTRTVYELKVFFKGESINKDKFHCLFSESDRRALALSVYFAKINKLPEADRLKAILVMDDPVTSFDSERITSILRILHSLKPRVKQLIVTTHYKGMASSMMMKFSQDASAIKIIQTPKGSMLEQATEAEMTETAHDKRYNEIMDFVEGRTNEDKLEQLRVFVEAEMRSRYKRQLISLNLNEKSGFNDCLQALKKKDYITESSFLSLDDLRGSLNVPSHNIQDRSLEDSRSYAGDMMKTIYNEI
ncbi:AAA family ATPase [Psychrobacter glaciei]|uniref:AAA family ATPase n=1 Tax=Psychrobacter glaciei TaxID=619771 RepID=UPI003F44E0EA